MKSVLNLVTKRQSRTNLWTNPQITLYHGTLKKHVKSILAGVDVALCDDGTDFGLGFYVTTNFRQALRFAKNKVRREGGRPVVIEFTLSRDALARLESLWFVRSARDANEFWTLVTACRKLGESNRGGGNWYDIVVGPVVKRYQRRTYWFQYDQISFHTDRAVDLLDNGVKREMKVQ